MIICNVKGKALNIVLRADQKQIYRYMIIVIGFGKSMYLPNKFIASNLKNIKYQRCI